jgi:hypothetical protein
MALILRTGCCLALIGIALGVATAGERTATDDFKPRPVTFSSTKLTLSDALAELKKQTGNTVRDARSTLTNPTVTMPKDAMNFWQALDAIGKQTGIGISTYQPDAGVALVDRQYRELRTHVSGAFRFTFKHIETSRDEETSAHLCRASFDVAWEPRIRLMHLNLEGAKAIAQEKNEGLPRQPVRTVIDTSATDFELRMKAPPRAVAKLNLVTGTIRAVGAPKMLEFAFTKPAKTMTQEIEGVTVTAKVVSQTKSLWLIELDVVHRKGSLIDVQSFENADLLKFKFHRVWLVWNKGAQEMLAGNDPQPTETGMRFSFDATRTASPLPAKDSDVVLHFRTPNRIMTFNVPFEFRDLPLP